MHETGIDLDKLPKASGNLFTRLFQIRRLLLTTSNGEHAIYLLNKAPITENMDRGLEVVFRIKFM